MPARAHAGRTELQEYQVTWLATDSDECAEHQESSTEAPDVRLGDDVISFLADLVVAEVVERQTETDG